MVRKPLGPNDYFNRLASRVTAALSVPTAAGPLYEVDTRLRPEGAKGMLVVSLDAFEQLPARGGLDVGAYGAVPRAPGVRIGRRPRAASARCIDSILRDAARFRQGCRRRREDAGRHGAHKPPRSALDVKLGPGGLVDLEFAVHVLQLTTHVGLEHRGSKWRSRRCRPKSWFRQMLSMH